MVRGIDQARVLSVRIKGTARGGQILCMCVCKEGARDGGKTLAPFIFRHAPTLVVVVVRVWVWARASAVHNQLRRKDLRGTFIQVVLFFPRFEAHLAQLVNKVLVQVQFI